MREVSCQVLELFFRNAKKKGVPAEQLAEGTGYPVAHLRNKRERVDWHALVVFLRNCSQVWTDEELVGLGKQLYAIPGTRPLRAMARLLFDARSFYEFVLKPAGSGNQAFSCIDSSIERVDDEHVRLKMKIREGYEDSREFFLVCLGNYQYMPVALDLPPAKVEMKREPFGATYEVEVPRGGGYLRKVKKTLFLPFEAREVAKELDDANLLLKRRYDALVEADEQLKAHALRLELLNELGRELTTRTELDSLARAIADLFVDRFKVSAVAVDVAEQGGGLRRLLARGGTEASPSRELRLSNAAGMLGRIELWGGWEIEDPVVSALVPWLSIAFENARHVRELRSYQSQLEERVQQRTADLQHTTAQLEQSLEKLKELDRAKTEFFANAQHELRTPLTLLLAPVETVANDSRVPEEAREELKASLRSGYRLLKLVNDLLDLSKVEAGRLRLQLAATDLAKLLKEATRPFQTQLRGRGIEVRFELPEKLPMVADPERLEQVALNVLSNAARFTPDGGRITVHAEVQDGRVHCFIENSGEHIPARDLELLFARFAQSSTASTRRYGTTGLGLAVVKELVELHGGTIEAANVPNGVRFTFTLPLSAAVDDYPFHEAPRPSARELHQYELSAEAQSAPAHSTELTHEKPILLVAEDNADLRAFLIRSLRSEYEILEAADGAAALKLARDKRPDVILSDLMMPELSGVEVCEQLKAEPATQGIPYILLTARSDMQTRLSGFDRGVDDYLVKPFSLDEVRARIRTHLRVRQLSERIAHREKLAALGTMVAGVAHEMRNPLNGILNSLKPLKSLLRSPDPDVAELLDIAIDSCERVEKISTQLLRQAHPGEWARSEVDVAENVRTAVTLMSFKVPPGVKLIADLDAAAGVAVVGEAGALNQVWVNLLDNALYAAGPNGQVTISADVTGNAISIDVADNGPGIPPAVLARVFDPFFTTKEVGTGTGLGLSFVRQIVEAHGGTVSVQSTPGEGARFRVTLPALTFARGEIRAS